MTTGEPGPVDHGHLVDHYEELRCRALAGDGDAWRWGLGVLRTRGVAAWLGAWEQMPPRPAAHPAGPAGPWTGGEPMVAVLASMALACLPGR